MFIVSIWFDPHFENSHSTSDAKMKHTKLTEHSETIVHGDDYDISIGSKDTTIKHVPWALHVRAAVDEQHDWLLTTIPDICTTQTNKSVHYFHVCSNSAPHAHFQFFFFLLSLSVHKQQAVYQV